MNQPVLADQTLSERLDEQFASQRRKRMLIADAINRRAAAGDVAGLLAIHCYLMLGACGVSYATYTDVMDRLDAECER